ncbi:MAG: hypothetical protein Q8908_06685 [Bacteroidota bacterium]|nr:hypothetical protein [Bacteroidota bacterium]
MKKYLFTLFFLLSISFAFSQTNYSAGYKKGFEAGYCYNVYGCIPPYPPVTPYLRVGESSSSFLDGYNRGMVDGLNKQKLGEIQNNISRFDNKINYREQVPIIIPEYKSFTPDFESLSKAFSAANVQYNNQRPNEEQQTDDELNKAFTKSINDLTNVDSLNLRHSNSQILRNSYLSMEFYPNNLPDGIYKVKRSESNVITEDPNLLCGSSKFTNGQLNHIEEVYAWVKDNRIITIADNLDIKKSKLFLPSLIINPNLKNDMISKPYSYLNVIINSPKIDKCVVQLQEQYWVLVNGEVKQLMETIKGMEDVLPTSTRTYFFIDYLGKYNFTQKSIQIQETQKNLAKTNFKNEGYYYAKATNGTDFFDVRKVFITNNKVIKYFIADGTEFIVQSGGVITGNTTKISILKKGNNNQEKLMEYTLYFY